MRNFIKLTYLLLMIINLEARLFASEENSCCKETIREVITNYEAISEQCLKYKLTEKDIFLILLQQPSEVLDDLVEIIEEHERSFCQEVTCWPVLELQRYLRPTLKLLGYLQSLNPKLFSKIESIQKIIPQNCCPHLAESFDRILELISDIESNNTDFTRNKVFDQLRRKRHLSSILYRRKTQRGKTLELPATIRQFLSAGCNCCHEGSPKEGKKVKVVVEMMITTKQASQFELPTRSVAETVCCATASSSSSLSCDVAVTRAPRLKVPLFDGHTFFRLYDEKNPGQLYEKRKRFPRAIRKKYPKFFKKSSPKNSQYS